MGYFMIFMIIVYTETSCSLWGHSEDIHCSDMFFLYSCQVGQARALYNFGNVYHAKGKSICWSGAEPGDFPEEVMMALRKAAEYYE